MTSAKANHVTNHVANNITTTQLERYLDNDLPQSDRTAIAAAIEADPALAAQLDRIRERDTLARLALTTAPTTPPAAPLFARTALRLALIASLTTAAFLLAINLWPHLNTARPTDRGGRLAHDIEPPGDATDTTPHESAANEFAAIDPAAHAHNLVVVEIKLASKPRPTNDDSASPAEPRPTRRNIRPAPIPSDTPAPVRLASAAPPAPAAAPSAREVINNLPPAQRLETALAWAIRGEQRTVAFETLRSLREENALPTELHTAAATLATRPELRGWIASYGLARGG